MEKLYYFAYGSNLHPLRMARRVASAVFVGITPLIGYRLRFHAQGLDHSAKCNIVKTGAPDDRVYGAVYSMDAAEQGSLDSYEGPAYGVDAVTVNVLGVDHDCLVYIAKPEQIDDQLEPYHWYQALVQLGAQYHGFPNSYQNDINGVSCKEDSDAGRVIEHTTLIQEMYAINQERLAVQREKVVQVDTVRNYAARMHQTLTEHFGVPQEAGLEDKIHMVAKHLDQSAVDGVNRLYEAYKRSLHAVDSVELTGQTANSFVLSNDALLLELQTRGGQIRAPVRKLALSKLAYRFADGVGVTAGVLAMFATLIAGTYYGYKLFDYGGAFFSFLLIFIISGLLIKPVLYIFKGLGILLAGAVEHAIRNYHISATVLAVLVLTAWWLGYTNGWPVLPNPLALTGR